jgi:hypothetical protein
MVPSIPSDVGGHFVTAEPIAYLKWRIRRNAEVLNTEGAEETQSAQRKIMPIGRLAFPGLAEV